MRRMALSRRMVDHLDHPRPAAPARYGAAFDSRPPRSRSPILRGRACLRPLPARHACRWRRQRCPAFPNAAAALSYLCLMAASRMQRAGERVIGSSPDTWRGPPCQTAALSSLSYRPTRVLPGPSAETMVRACNDIRETRGCLGRLEPCSLLPAAGGAASRRRAAPPLRRRRCPSARFIAGHGEAPSHALHFPFLPPPPSPPLFFFFPPPPPPPFSSPMR